MVIIIILCGVKPTFHGCYFFAYLFIISCLLVNCKHFRITNFAYNRYEYMRSIRTAQWSFIMIFFLRYQRSCGKIQSDISN